MTQPVMMALVFTVLGMLLYFGSQGLPDQSARKFTTHPMFRPVNTRPRVALAGASSGRLDAAALDALSAMEAPSEPSNPDGEAPAAQGWQKPRWFSQRPW